MTGNYENNSSPHHNLQPGQDPYSVPPYNYVQPPLGSDSGSGPGYVPMPPGGFSPVPNKDFMDQSVSHMQAASMASMAEPWNNNERPLEASAYDCY